MTEEPTLGIVVYRLQALEEAVKKMEVDTTNSFANMSAQISNLTYVHRDVYAAHQTAIAEALKAVKDIAEEAKSSARLAIQMVGGTALGAIVTGLMVKAVQG